MQPSVHTGNYYDMLDATIKLVSVALLAAEDYIPSFAADLAHCLMYYAAYEIVHHHRHHLLLIGATETSTT